MARKAIVIGSGVGGSSIARALSDSFDVTVLERGPRNGIRYPEIEHLRVPLSTTRTFCHGAGGTSNLWDNGLIPMRQADLTESAFADVLADARPFMDRAAHSLHFEPESYEQEFSEVHSEISGLMGEIAGFPADLDCILYPKRYRPLKLPANVAATYGVSDLKFDTGNGAVTGVRYRGENGAGEQDCDLLVISGGSMGSPFVVNDCLRALGHSGDPAGNGFMDHPMGFVGKVRFNRDISEKIHQFSTLQRDSYTSRNMIRVKSRCGRYTGAVFLRPSATLTNNPMLYRYKSSLGASKGMLRVKNALSPRFFHPDVLMEAYQHVTGHTPFTRTFTLLFISEQRPSENRIFQRDGRLCIDWEVKAEEYKAFGEMLESLESQLSPLAEKLKIQTRLSTPWLWSGAHHSGTVALGDGDEHLVDPQLKLKAADNVYVCDASVIPEHSYTNTGLTIASLAQRLAARLRDSS